MAEVANTDLDSDVVCTYYLGQPDNVHRFDCTNKMYGRYVRVTLIATTILNVFEIEVTGVEYVG